MYPLLPILLTSILGAPAAVVGLVEGVAEGVSAALKYLSGRVSDRVGRKPAILAGYGLAAVGKVVIAAASIWPAVMVGRVVDRMGKGIRGAPRDALLAEGLPPESLGRAFGFHRAADTVGAIIGPLLGLAILSATGGNISTALWIAVIPAVISVLLILPVHEDRPAPHLAGRHGRPSDVVGAGGSLDDPDTSVPAGVAEPPERRHAFGVEGTPDSDVAKPRLPRQVRTVAALLGLFAVVNFPDALVLLRLTEVGFGASALMGAYALFNLANALIAYPAGALSDRWPRPRVFAVGLICFAVGYLGLGLADTPGLMVPLLIAYGGFAGITEGVGRAWISSLAPPEARGHAQGLYQGLTGAGVLVAGLWAGLLWQSGAGNGTLPLMISGSVALVAAAGLLARGDRLSPRVDPAGTGP